MHTAIIAYPDVQERDRDWIEAVRRDEDPGFEAVRPHFTLAFPAPVPPKEAVSHAASVVRCFEPIHFELCSTRVVRDQVRGGSHLFLVPSVGAEAIEALHEALYQGPFSPYRLPNVPFIPHMTIGAHATEAESQALAARLTVGVPLIRGRILAIDLVEVCPYETPSVQSIPLGAA